MGCRRLYAYVAHLPSYGRRWPVEHELGAQAVELLHACLRVLLASYRTKLAHPSSVQIPEAYRVPRPTDSQEAEAEPAPAPTSRFNRQSIRRALLGR